MSDSEDTDDLLLIPPDFFTVQSEPEPPYYGIVDSLIKQVFILQDRIEGIEYMSDVSLNSYCNNIDLEAERKPIMTNHRPYNRRYYSYDDLYQPTSVERTPQKAHRQLGSLPNSPNVATLKRNVTFSTPQKHLQFSHSKDDSEMVSDIDKFLSNVRTIQRGHVVRNLEGTFNNFGNRGGTQTEKVNTWQCGDRKETVPDLGAEPQDNSDLKSIYQPASSGNLTFTSTTLDKSSDSSSESTQLTALAQNVKQDDFDQKRTDLLDMQRKQAEDKYQKKRGINTLTDNLGLLNLADLWGAGRAIPSQTAHEERLRRQHCEQLIRDLQAKNLEMQQKLAVAIQVDQTKNDTIEQFQEVLATASAKIEHLIAEKQSWEVEVGKLKSQLSLETDRANKKIAYYEREAAKSANLLQDTNDKITELETRCTELQTQLKQIELKFDEVQNNYQREYEKNQKLADIISQKEIELKENKTVLGNAREEVLHSRQAVEVCQTELTTLKNECSLLQSEVRDSKSVVTSLNEQKKQISSELQIYKANEKSLRDALEQSKHKLETTKVELRNFYQGQLELIVDNKRKEMQNQLDRERESNVEEMKRKELSMAKTAANHIKEISEKCALETKLLEQKYQEEVRLYQMQLAQKNKEVEQLRGKLALLPEKRAEIAKHLQKVMENQWNEALKMIGERSSPLEEVKQVTEYDETPVSSRGPKQNETAIQKYIDMLLNRQPGNPETEPADNNKRSTWHAPVRSRKPSHK